MKHVGTCASKYAGAVAACLVLLLMLSTLPDSAVAAAAFGIVVTAVVVTMAVVTGRKGLLSTHFDIAYGPDGAAGRLRGSFRRQQRPDEAGRPMPRAPGALAGVSGQ